MSFNSQLNPDPPIVRASTLDERSTLQNGPGRAPPIQTSNLKPYRLGSPKHKHRALILAFDGTSNLYEETNTNVVKLYSMLRKDLPERQLLYYQTGIGTYNANPGIWTPTLTKLSKAVDLATAAYLDAHICSGYRFLVDHYRTGDKICLFGFSRGAYTARCLAGMLHKVGLLTPGNKEQIRFAYDVYRDTSPLSNYRSEGFKQTFSRLVDITFLGVWDTVSSVGVLYGRHLPFTSSNSIVRTFRHALALDERRAKFKANVWHRSVGASTDELLGLASWDPEHGTGMHDDTADALQRELAQRRAIMGVSRDHAHSHASSEDDEDEIVVEGGNTVEEGAAEDYPPAEEGAHAQESDHSQLGSNLISGKTIRRIISRKSRGKKVSVDSAKLMRAQGDLPDGGSPTLHHFCDECDKGLHQPTDVLEVWFAGCHSDVGGGAVPNWTTNSLSGPSLRWMVHEIIDARAGVVFDEEALAKLGIDPTPGAPRSRYQSTSDMKNQESKNPQVGPQEDKFGPPRNPEDHSSGINEHTSATCVPTMTPAEQQARDRDYHDAISPMHDQLVLSPLWWLLELFPIWWHFQDKEGKWHRRWKPNISFPRVINNSAPVNIHSSVRTRMEAGIGYRPRAKFSGEPNWVE